MIPETLDGLIADKKRMVQTMSGEWIWAVPTTDLVMLSASPAPALVHLAEAFANLVAAQQPLPADAARILNEHYWDLLGEAAPALVSPQCEKCGDTGFVFDGDGIEDNCDCGALARRASKENRVTEHVIEIDQDGKVHGNDLEQALASALNRFSAENASNTPDWILAQFLLGCLAAWNQGLAQRATWYGHPLTPGHLESSPLPPVPASVSPQVQETKDDKEQTDARVDRRS